MLSRMFSLIFNLLRVKNVHKFRFKEDNPNPTYKTKNIFSSVENGILITLCARVLGMGSSYGYQL